MRRLAADLGVEAMSLYYHLPNKEGLLDGLVDTVIAEIAEEVRRSEPAGGSWRVRLRRRCLSARAVMLRHPWAPALLGSRPSIPPGVFAYFDEIVGLMLNGGLSPRLAHRAVHALGTMVFGFVQELFSPAVAGGDTDVGAAEADLAAMAASVPHLTAMVSAEMHAADDPTLGWCDSQAEFEFTLDLLLDGLERASRSAGDRGSGAG